MKKPIECPPIISPTVVRHSINHLRNLVFEVTDACNLRCKYCAYADFYEGYNEEYDERKNRSYQLFAGKYSYYILLSG